MVCWYSCGRDEAEPLEAKRLTTHSGTSPSPVMTRRAVEDDDEEEDEVGDAEMDTGTSCSGSSSMSCASSAESSSGSSDTVSATCLLIRSATEHGVLVVSYFNTVQK